MCRRRRARSTTSPATLEPIDSIDAPRELHAAKTCALRPPFQTFDFEGRAPSLDFQPSAQDGIQANSLALAPARTRIAAPAQRCDSRTHAAVHQIRALLRAERHQSLRVMQVGPNALQCAVQ